MSESSITVVFQHQGRTGSTALPWVTNKRLQTYFHEYPLKAYGLSGKRLTHAMYNRKGERVRLSYVPLEGDAIVLVQIKR